MIRAHFTVELPAACPPDQALRRLLDLRAHDRLIPLTRVNPAVSAEELTVGSRFVGRTGVGRFGFDDHMRIEALGFEPAAATIVKRGRVIRGVVHASAEPSARCRMMALDWASGRSSSSTTVGTCPAGFIARNAGVRDSARRTSTSIQS